MITKETARKLKKQLTIFLARKAEIKAKEAELEALKKTLDREFDAVINEFDEGKLHVPGTGVISVVNNPPKLVWRASGQPLLLLQRAELAPSLPTAYVYEDIDIKKLKDAIDRGDKDLEAKLMLEMVKLEQSSCYDIKKV